MNSYRSALQPARGMVFTPAFPPEREACGRRVAVVDIGSNSVRLVVFEAGTGLPSVLYNEKVHCGLARGLDETCIHGDVYGTRSSALLAWDAPRRPSELRFADGPPCSHDYEDFTHLLRELAESRREVSTHEEAR